MKIIVTDSSYSEDLRQMILDAAGNNSVVFPESGEDLLEAVDEEVEVIFGGCNEGMMARAPNLRWVQSSSAGMDAFLTPALRDSDIVVTNAAGLYGPNVADQGFALLLGLVRGIHHFARRQENHRWDNRVPTPIIEIPGLTIGIVGMGGIGGFMANRAKGFDTHVIAVDAFRTDKPENVDELMPIDQLPDLMSRSDVVMIACPLTDETRGLINASNLALMKPTAYLINVARGPIVDQEALVEALENGTIAGAGLDVTEVEPLDKDSPLWDMDNVIITPHVAGVSQRRFPRLVEFFCNNLKNYLAGEPLANVVRKELGF